MESTNKISFNLSELVSIMLQYYSFLDEYGQKIKEEKIENKEFIKKKMKNSLNLTISPKNS